MNYFEDQYRRLIKNCLNGELKSNRNGFTFYSFGESLKINLQKGFPIVTGKKIFFEKAYHEYKWFVDGLTTTHYLKQNNIHWWDKFADKKGNLGKTYGYQLRSFNGSEDQLEQLHWCLKTEPESRRMHVTLWNPSELKETKLPPCYTGFTFSWCNGKLNMEMHFRSSDVFLGLPYDICVGALFLINIAEFHNMTPNYLKISITDAHIYENHLKQVNEYMNRRIYKLPQYDLNDNLLYGYVSGDYIKAILNE